MFLIYIYNESVIFIVVQVLQRSVDNRLNLYSDNKEQSTLVAQLAVIGLSSQPVDHEENGHRKQASSDAGKLLGVSLWLRGSFFFPFKGGLGLTHYSYVSHSFPSAGN